MDSIGKGLDPLEALEHIDPAGLNYQEWLTVGMGPVSYTHLTLPTKA